jgi:hypothetical protein
LTPFIAFEIVAHAEDRQHCLRFVLKLPIDGIPADRLDHIVSAIISDRERFLRYLWLMLQGDGGSAIAWDGVLELGERGPETPASDYVSLPLLETLVRALSRSPDKIEHVNGLIEQLKRTPRGRVALPAGFDALWSQVMETWRQLS